MKRVLVSACLLGLILFAHQSHSAEKGGSVDLDALVGFSMSIDQMDLRKCDIENNNGVITFKLYGGECKKHKTLDDILSKWFKVNVNRTNCELTINPVSLDLFNGKLSDTLSASEECKIEDIQYSAVHSKFWGEETALTDIKIKFKTNSGCNFSQIACTRQGEVLSVQDLQNALGKKFSVPNPGSISEEGLNLKQLKTGYTAVHIDDAALPTGKTTPKKGPRGR